MRAIDDQLAQVVARELSATPATLAELVDRFSALDFTLPGDAWARWLLLALHRHVARQAWVGEVVRDRVGVSLDELSHWGALAHPESGQSGYVPGSPDWKYFFHGNGCMLRHASGELLDVNFYNGRSDYVDPYFYQHYLESVSGGPHEEQGLVFEGPFDAAWMTDLVSLQNLGWVDDGHAVGLTSAGRSFAELLQPSGVDMTVPYARAWHACVVGRLDVALSCLPNRDGIDVLKMANAELVEQRIAVLKLRFDQDGSYITLKALAALGRDHAEDVVVRQLRRRPMDGVVSTALGLLAEWDVSAHRGAILDTLAGATGEVPPDPYIRSKCVELLMASGSRASLTRREQELLRAALKKRASACDGEVGLLLYMLDGRDGFEYLRAALGSEIDSVRTEAACALGMIGTPQALSILRSGETLESERVLALLRDARPVDRPAPAGEGIVWQGKDQRVFTGDEIALAHAGDLTADCFARMCEQYSALMRQWLGIS